MSLKQRNDHCVAKPDLDIVLNANFILLVGMLVIFILMTIDSKLWVCVGDKVRKSVMEVARERDPPTSGIQRCGRSQEQYVRARSLILVN